MAKEPKKGGRELALKRSIYRRPTYDSGNAPYLLSSTPW